MRKLFKGKTIENNKWIQGNYAENSCAGYIENSEIKLRIRPGTLSQFMGKNSNSGQDIWENDIIYTPKGEIGVIKFNDFEFKFQLQLLNGKNRDISFADLLYFTPLGNIFDNSIEEFLK